MNKINPCPLGVQHEQSYKNLEEEEIEITRSEQMEKDFSEKW